MLSPFGRDSSRPFLDARRLNFCGLKEVQVGKVTKRREEKHREERRQAPLAANKDLSHENRNGTTTKDWSVSLLFANAPPAPP